MIGDPPLRIGGHYLFTHKIYGKFVGYFVWANASGPGGGLATVRLSAAFSSDRTYKAGEDFTCCINHNLCKWEENSPGRRGG